MPPNLMIYDHRWPATPATCPPDFDFTHWLAYRAQEADADGGWRLFHMGTGDHHHVGQTIASWGRGEGGRLDPPNNPYALVGLTASPGELESYVRLAIEQPDITGCYTTVFGDIYTFHPETMLAPLDVATLFHLGEFWDPARLEYGAVSDGGVLRRFRAAIRPGGFLILYAGSMAYDRVAGDVIRAIERGWFEEVERFMSLIVLRRRESVVDPL